MLCINELIFIYFFIFMNDDKFKFDVSLFVLLLVIFLEKF